MTLLEDFDGIVWSKALYWMAVDGYLVGKISFSF